MGVVQLVEHFVANEDVAGPIPVIHSKGLPIVSCYWEVCQLWRAEFKYAPPFAASAVVETVAHRLIKSCREVIGGSNPSLTTRIAADVCGLSLGN